MFKAAQPLSTSSNPQKSTLKSGKPNQTPQFDHFKSHNPEFDDAGLFPNVFLPKYSSLYLVKVHFLSLATELLSHKARKCQK